MSDSSDSDSDDDELHSEQSDEIYFSPNEDEDGLYEGVCIKCIICSMVYPSGNKIHACLS